MAKRKTRTRRNSAQKVEVSGNINANVEIAEDVVAKVYKDVGERIFAGFFWLMTLLVVFGLIGVVIYASISSGVMDVEGVVWFLGAVFIGLISYIIGASLK